MISKKWDDILQIPFINKLDKQLFNVEIKRDEEEELTLNNIIEKAKVIILKNYINFDFKGSFDYSKDEIDYSLPISYFKCLYPFYFVGHKEKEENPGITRTRRAIKKECLEFADVRNKEGLIEKNFSDSAKPWRKWVKGLNILGICKNKGCEAYKNEVVCNIGMVSFNLISDSNKVKCPICKKFVNPATCGFSRCQYKFSGYGRKNEDEEPKKYLSKYKKVEKDLEYFDPKEGGKAFWDSLQIICKPLDFQNSSENICSYCSENITYASTDRSEIGCGHLYHKNCAQIDHDSINGKCIRCRGS